MNHQHELIEIKQEFLDVQIEITDEDLRKLAIARNQICSQLQWVEMDKNKLYEIVRTFIDFKCLYQENYLSLLKYAIYSYYILRSKFDIEVSDDEILNLLGSTFKRQLSMSKPLSIREAENELMLKASLRKEKWSIMADFSDVKENLFQIIADGYASSRITSLQQELFYHEIEEIAFQCVKQLNYAESTSISRKQRDHILRTISYLILHGSSAMKEDICLCQHDLSFYFNQGMEIVKDDIEKIRNILEDIKLQKVNFAHERYASIIHEQIPSFLNSVHQHDGLFHYCYLEDDLDYPLIDGLPLDHHMYHKQGSDLMLYYIQRFQIENSICFKFNHEVDELMDQFQQLNGLTVSDLNLNVCSLLLNQLIINCALFNKISILFEKEEIETIKKINIEDVHSIFMRSTNILKELLTHDLISYISAYENQFTEDFIRFIHGQYNMFIYPINEDKNIFYLKKPQSSSEFLSDLNKLYSMEKTEDKIVYLRQKDLSIYDLFDLLEHDIFYGEEYNEYFSTLSSIEIALIIRMMHQDAFVFNQQNGLNDSFINQMEADMQWQYSLIDFLKTLNRQKRKEIESWMNQIKIKNDD